MRSLITQSFREKVTDTKIAPHLLVLVADWSKGQVEALHDGAAPYTLHAFIS